MKASDMTAAELRRRDRLLHNLVLVGTTLSLPRLKVLYDLGKSLQRTAAARRARQRRGGAK
jgi:hypothetical protein